MKSRIAVAVVSPDWLSALGIRALIGEEFPYCSVFLYNNSDDYQIALPEHDFDIVLTTCGVCVENAIEISENCSRNQLVSRIAQEIDRDDASAADEKLPSLTARETDVLRLVTQGLLNKEIADRLDISLHTVISHRKNITSKLGIKTVSGLTIYALMHGVIH